MIFVDELTPLKLYPSKRKFYAPFDEENKKNGSLIYLMGRNIEDTIKMINSPTMINRRYFVSYYTEKDVGYFMNNEEYNQTDVNDFILENYLHELTAKERQDLPDSAFGLPKDRKYPLHDEEHVKLAIKFFNYATGEDREELAKNIKKAAKKFGMEISVGKKNKLKNYLEEGSYILEKSKSSTDDGEKDEAETMYNDFINNEQIKPEYANSDKDGIDSVYLHDKFWPILSRFIDKNKDNEYLLNHAKKKLSKFKDKDATPEKYQKKAALMTFVEKELKKIDEYLAKIEQEDIKDDYDDEDEDDFEESALLENVFISNNDLYKDFDKFESGESNILLITGLSGSGKSTLASQIASKYGAEYIELDCMDPSSNICLQGLDVIKKAGEVFYDYFMSHKQQYQNLVENKMTHKDITLMMDDIIQYCFSWCSKRKNRKFVIEGIQLYDFFNYYKKKPQYPIIIKGTSVVQSFLRKIKREKWNIKGLISSAPQCLKMMVNDDKQLKSLADSLNEAVNNSLYFLSETNMDQKVLQPRIPDNFFTKNGYEDNTTKRVCFATSIGKCLMALSQKCTNMVLYVHIPIGNYNVVNPSLKQIPDKNITNEKWITEPVKVKCIGKIRVIGDAGKDGHEFKYGNNAAELYDWKWEWVEKYLEQSSIREEKSTIDKDFKPNGYKSLSSFKRIHITDDIINKYKSEYPCLKHVRCKDTKEYICDGYIWMDNDKLVCMVGSCEYTDDLTKWIVSLEVMKDYKGYGLSKQILDYAVKNMNCKYLSVNKNNEVAKSIYDKYGFKVYKESDTMYYMCYGVQDTEVEEQLSLTEARNNPILMKKYLYRDRIRTQKEVLLLYKNIKEKCPVIKRTFTSMKKYKGLNLFYDLSHYMEIFLNNIKLKNDKAVLLYFDFLNKYIKGANIPADYKKRTIIIPVFENITQTPIYARGRLNPIAIIHRMTKIGRIHELRDAWGNYDIILLGEKGYFKLDLDKFDKKFLPRFESLVNRLLLKETIEDVNEDKPTSKSIANDTIEKIEKAKGIEIVNIAGAKSLTGQRYDPNSIKDTIRANDKVASATSVDFSQADKARTELSNSKKKQIEKVNSKKEDISVKVKEINKIKKVDDDKEKIVQSVKLASNGASSVDDAIKNLDEDPEILAILQQLETQETNEIKMNATRAKRMETVKDTFVNSQYKGKKVSDILAEPDSKPLEQTELKVDSINPEWKEMSFINFNKAYDLDKDILDILNSFSSKSMPVAIRNIEIENTSTSEDFIDTWKVDCEDGTGQRFSLKFDVPKLKDNRFMRLHGNDKTINAQLMLLPIIKTDQDVVQIVSNYNKIFIKKFGTAGKSTNRIDRIIKTLNTMLEKKETALTIIPGDNSKICAKYELPIEYIDLATNFSKIENSKFVIMLNQDEIYEKYGDKIDPNKGTPIGYDKEIKQVMYIADVNGNPSLSLYYQLCNSDKFKEIYNSKKNPTKANYSKASILNTEIPVIVVAAYSVGLEKVLKTGNISYKLQSKKPDDDGEVYDYIRFNDGYLIYENTVENSLLLNGLKECDTQSHSLTEINSKEIWLDFLDEFGGRIKADGLDNFYDLMIDPMTASVCRKYGLPETYIEILLYANNLLVDNKYNRHVDITGNRYRTNELIAGYIYKSLATSYGEYKNSLKRNRKGAKMSMKQSVVVDSLLVDSTESDLSISRPLSAIESANTVSFKGLSGMNSDRSYGLDKRTYDETMINQLALSTGFAGNVGITRQATIDMAIDSNRGYIKKSGIDDMSVTKTFCMTEALTPYGVTHDDPFRSAMTFIQTSKHEMSVAKPMPSLITNGADEAVPYLAPSIFAVKAKKKGKVVELKSDIGQEYMIIEYSDGEKEFVDLNTNIFKNSDGGFYGDIKLDTDLKIGSVVKPNDVVAYDRKSFTKHYGPNDNLAYEIGTLAKIAILNTDENFEDSAIIDKYLSDALASRITVKIDKSFDKNTNVYNLVKKGSHIEEGDSLCIIQNSFDDADANALMKQLSGDEDEISALGRINIKSKVTGVVEDIVIYRTVEIEELSPTLQKIVKEYEKPIKEQKKIMQKHGIKDFSSLKPDYKLDSTGKLKNVKDGVLIEFYLSYGDKMSVGDKVVFYSANKGVVKNIFPEGDEPKSNFRPNEKINAFIGITSVNERMVTSIQHVAAVNKIMIELDRKVKETMGVPWKTIEEMTEI